MGKAAIYVRVSTDYASQRDSPNHQIATCREYAESLRLDTSEETVYNDAGFSGTEMENRSEVKRLLEDARAGKFDAVLFTAISRFSRDMTDAFNLKKRLERIYGIRLISIEEGYDSQVEGRNNDMVFTVHAMLAAHKSKEMSLAIRRGLRQAAKRGRHIGNTCPYGYVKTPDKTLVPDAAAAQVVRRIFSMYRQGDSCRTIAGQLNKQGIPTPSASRKSGMAQWQPSTVNAILHNPVYIGRIVANKWTVAQDIEASRKNDRPLKKAVVRDEGEWVVVDNAHEPIVSMDLYTEVQKLLKQKAGKRQIRTTSNLLAGLLYCGRCRGPMVVTGSSRPAKEGRKQYKYIVCSNHRRFGRGACANRQAVRYDYVLNAVLSYLADAFDASFDAASGKVSQELAAGAAQWVKQRDRNLVSQVEALRAQLQKNRHEQLENLRAYREGLFSRSLVIQSQRELATKAKQMQQEIVRLRRSRQQSLTLGEPNGLQERLNLFRHSADYDEVTVRLAIQQALSGITFDSGQTIRVILSWSSAN